ncbi:MAG TPA: hypothetical protein VLJ37_00530 [bacterium]|nr:hypothetical protein [bacterium]
MSLKSFHIAFIIVSVSLSLFMVIWGFQGYRVSRDAVSLGVGITGVVGLLALVPYGRWFRNKFKKMAVVLLAAISTHAAGLPTAWACALCFGDSNSEMTRGLKAGILLLILVVAGVLAGIASVGITWARRAKALEG